MANGQWTIRATDPNTLYFQLFDLDNASTTPYSAPYNFGFFGINQVAYQRYIPGIGSSNVPVVMVVTFPSLDPANVITVTATQDPNDGSVFSIDLPGYTSLGLAPASGNVNFSLTEGIKTRTWVVQNMIGTEIANSGSC